MLDKLPHPIIQAGIVAAQFYHLLTGSIFLNTAAEDATGLEKVANHLLVPCQYVLAGQKGVVCDEGYQLRQRFDYTSHLWKKSGLALFAVPYTTGIGLTLKGLAYLSKETRERHKALVDARDGVAIHSNNDYYRSLGIDLGDGGWIEKPKHKRHADRDGYMEKGRDGLREIARVLKKHNIPFWLDCGSALGAQRYGGVIPWDGDIDLAILEPDHFNVKQALNELDKSKYMVQDWSGRYNPYSYLMLYVREENVMIDIYHHKIDPRTKTAKCINWSDDSIFLSQTWKDRENATGPAESFETIFPLKKCLFDGIEVFVPNDIIGYLQHRYGENIEPVKIYNEKTGLYEKDLSHPYWKLEYAH